jgi:hypothetical protein
MPCRRISAVRIEQSSVNLSATHYSARLEERHRQISVRYAAGGSAETRGVATLDDDDLALEGKYRVLQWFAESVFGRRIRMCRLPAGSVDQAPVQSGVQVRVSQRSTVVEAEQTTFRAEGSVQTAGGRAISFRAELTLSRQDIRVEQSGGADATDPLVLNFEGGGVRLLDNQVEFDLNSDGVMERMPELDASSGILFIDRNSDGKATDGNELFGPTTGDGFQELAALDDDANGWIDEGDAIFGQLRMWFQQDDRVSTLSELGVGALYASSVATPFSLDGGVIRSSGVYLNEDGGAGTIQQVDLVTEPVA